MRDYLYGINPAFEAIRGRRRELHCLYLNKGSENNPRLQKLITLAEKATLPIKFTDRQELFNLCNSREHQGCVLEAGTFQYSAFADLLGEKKLLLLDNINDPHNIGAITRSAEALGWQNILLPRRGAPLILPSVVKAAAGACEFLQVAVNCSSNQYVKIALEEGYSIVSLDAKADIPIEEIAQQKLKKILLVIGGESSGVSQFILNNSTYKIAIPQSGKINSLNASVAAALALYLLG